MMDDFFVSEPSQVDITEPLDDQSIEDDDAYLVGHALYDYEVCANYAIYAKFAKILSRL